MCSQLFVSLCVSGLVIVHIDVHTWYEICLCMSVVHTHAHTHTVRARTPTREQFRSTPSPLLSFLSHQGKGNILVGQSSGETITTRIQLIHRVPGQLLLVIFLQIVHRVSI